MQLFFKYRDNKLVAANSANLAGFLGAKTFEDAGYTHVTGTHESAIQSIDLFKKKDEFLLAQAHSENDFEIYVKSESFQGLLEVIKLLEPFNGLISYIDESFIDADDDDCCDDEDCDGCNAKPETKSANEAKSETTGPAAATE